MIFASTFRKLLFSRSNVSLTNTKAMAFSTQNGALFAVAASQSDHNSGTLYEIDSFGKARDFLKQPDLSWFSDFTILSDGTIIAW